MPCSARCFSHPGDELAWSWGRQRVDSWTLARYTLLAEAELDNNSTPQGLPRVVLGRRNVRAGRRAANLFSS